MRGAMRDRQRVEDRLTGSHALGEFVGVLANWRVGDGIRAQLLGKCKAGKLRRTRLRWSVSAGHSSRNVLIALYITKASTTGLFGSQLDNSTTQRISILRRATLYGISFRR